MMENTCGHNEPMPSSEPEEERAAYFARIVARFYRQLRDEGIGPRMAETLTYGYMMQSLALDAQLGEDD